MEVLVKRGKGIMSIDIVFMFMRNGAASPGDKQDDWVPKGNCA